MFDSPPVNQPIPALPVQAAVPRWNDLPLPNTPMHAPKIDTPPREEPNFDFSGADFDDLNDAADEPECAPVERSRESEKKRSVADIMRLLKGQKVEKPSLMSSDPVMNALLADVKSSETGI
jgi:hypothetical protein